MAKSLLRQHDPALVHRWVAYTERKLADGWVPDESPAAWLVSAIRSGDWVIPSWFQTPEERQAEVAERKKLAEEDAKRRQADLEREQREAEEQRRAVERKLGVGERTRETWEAVKALLEEREQFSIAFHSTFLLPLNGRTATLATTVPFFSKMIEKHSDALRAALTEVSGREIDAIAVEVFEPTATAGEE